MCVCVCVCVYISINKYTQILFSLVDCWEQILNEKILEIKHRCSEIGAVHVSVLVYQG